jgi:hypothetical protein
VTVHRLSRRSVRAALAIATLVIMASALPAAAGAKHPTGARLLLFVADGSTRAANTAFYVQHGFAFDPGTPSAGLWRFTLDVDGISRAPSYVQSNTYPSGDLESREWIFNFPSGLSGTHTFVGHWLVPCGIAGFPCNGLPRNTLVKEFDLSATVSFAP